ncbi:hypothetical protein POM88_042018 [Heracleum sosnowskyi]|uniref:Uncharacterized protein n=1 Tax=Heracleum sosnowskyi TaxID=360622 RepID=A0AAD8HFH0_9APIA|nr:hypothetical protein POM88_042018 [Heracleum sosnowskyi]
MYVYCETIKETHGEEVTLSQYASPNTTQDLEFEKQQILDIFNLEGIPEDMYDIDHLLSKPIRDEQTSEVSDHDNISFHEDSSNIDSTYEDVRSHKAKMVDVPIETLNWNTEKSQSQQADPSNDGNVPSDAPVTSEAPVSNDAPVTSEAPVSNDAPVTSEAPVSNDAPTQGSSTPRRRKKNKKNQSFPAENPSDHTQGGIFSVLIQHAKVSNTTIGIQPQRNLLNGSQVTTMKQLEQAKNERIIGLKKGLVGKFECLVSSFEY